MSTNSEPCTESPLFEMPGVLCTPHLGASTEEAQTQVAVEGRPTCLIDFLTTGNIRHAVNMTSLDEQTRRKFARISRSSLPSGPNVVGQLDASTAESCRLEYRGDVAERQTSLLSSSFACGLLSGSTRRRSPILSVPSCSCANAESNWSRTNDRAAGRLPR